MAQFTGGDGCQVLTPQRDGTPWTLVPVQYLPPSACRLLYTIKHLAPQLLLLRGRCYYTCALLYTRDAYRLPHKRHVCQRPHVTRVDYPTDYTCTTVHVHVRHATTDRGTRALPTRGHARSRVHLADRRITNLCARRSLCYSTPASWLHVGTPAHVYTVYGHPVLNLRACAGGYTTVRSGRRILPVKTVISILNVINLYLCICF